MDITKKIEELAKKYNTSFEFVRDLYCDMDLDLTWKELLCALSWGNPYEYVRVYLKDNYHIYDGVMIRKDSIGDTVVSRRKQLDLLRLFNQTTFSKNDLVRLLNRPAIN